MMDLKQLKIRILKEDDNILTIEEIDRLLNNS